MEIVNNPNERSDFWTRCESENRKGRIITGIVIIAAGVLFLLREMGMLIPEWLFTWQMLLITIGLVSLLKQNFRSMGGFIMILIGGGFLLKEFMPDFAFSSYIWPIAIIAVGLFVLLKPKGHRPPWARDTDWREAKKGDRPFGEGTGEDIIELNAIFGSVKKNIVSHRFRGGEVNAVFGGTEINLMQADIEGTVELEVNSIFGGNRLLIPPHWEVKSELTAVLGGVEDKRSVTKDKPEGNKVLVLRGSAIFGGIEITSY